jgi:integrase
MPRRSKGPRLWLEPARRDKRGNITHYPTWVIRDRSDKHFTGFDESQAVEAQKALADYIIGKHNAPRVRDRDPAQCRVTDVISIYCDDVVAKHARPAETAARLERVGEWFAKHAPTLAHLNKKTCEKYTASRGKEQAARRELEDLRAAVRHHWEEGLCSSLVPVSLPQKSVPREKWLDRSEAARWLWGAWRMRQVVFGKESKRWTGRHLARFILVGLYTGTRSAAICGAALGPTEGRGFVTIERGEKGPEGIFYRRAAGRRETKKKQPPVKLLPRLATHIERWVRLGIAKNAVVEWNGRPVKRVVKGLRAARKAAKLGPDVTAHTLRHTCATWLMQAGTDQWEAAGFLGMSVETLEKVYGHHHPDYQAGAVNALSNPRKKRRGSNVVNLHETDSGPLRATDVAADTVRSPRQFRDRLNATKREQGS